MTSQEFFRTSSIGFTPSADKEKVTSLQAVFPILMGKPSADEGDLRTGNFFTDG